MTRIAARTLKGFRDTLPADMAPQRAMLRTITDTFGHHGFQPLDTPALEYAEILTGKYGDEGDKLLYRFKDHGDRDVAMRYDLTVPLARVMAQSGGQLPNPFRRYQVGKVWRADKPQRGRFREFMQCDVDICGSDAAMADAEVIVCGLAVLRALGIEGFALHLNHRGLLRDIQRHLDVQPEHEAAFLRWLDKLDKIGPAEVAKGLQQDIGMSPEQAASLWPVLGMGQERRPTTSLVAEVLGDRTEALGRLQQVIALVEAAGFGEHLVFDPSIARGLDYYTGVIYETRLTDPEVAGIGAVMSGGRYDGLIGMFGKQTVPAVGISLGLSRLLAALRELDLVANDSGTAEVFVTVFDRSPESGAAAMRCAAAMRTAGISVELSLKAGKLGKQFGQADRRGCRFAAVVGPDEAERGVVKLKDLGSGNQETVALADAIARVQKKSA